MKFAFSDDDGNPSSVRTAPFDQIYSLLRFGSRLLVCGIEGALLPFIGTPSGSDWACRNFAGWRAARRVPVGGERDMGIVLSIWQSLFQAEREIKVIIVGLAAAGKSTILYFLHLGEVVITQPTIGSNVEEVQRGKVRFQCWDLGGQESLRKTWATYFTNTEAVVLVVDSSDRQRIPTVKKELQMLMSHEDLHHAVLLVLANKQDVKGAMTPAEISVALELHEIKGRSWHIEASCALTGEGLEEGFEWIAQTLNAK